MVFNKDVLFIHLGKTGGMSVTDYLCNTLKPPVYHVLPQSSLEKVKALGYEEMIPGNRHGSLSAAQEIIAPYNLKLADFKLILVVVRNPFDLHFSYFKQLRKPHAFKRLSENPKNKNLLDAAMGEYDAFAQKDFVHYNGMLSTFFEIDGKRPENLQIVKFEELATKVPELVRPYVVNDYPFPHENKSIDNSLPPKRLSDEAAAAIKHKYYYIFKNFYPALLAETERNRTSETQQKSKYLFVGGCARSGTSILTNIIGMHQRVVLGMERYNNLMKPQKFQLSAEHFEKNRFLTIHENDTGYTDFNKFRCHGSISEKWDSAALFGTKYTFADQVFWKLKQVFGNFHYLYIYRNIYDVAESWNRKAANGINWPAGKNYIMAVERWNESLGNTLTELRSGADIICLSYEEMLYSKKSIQPIFDRLGLQIDENVLRELTEARKKAPKKKFEKGMLSENEVEYIRNNARHELYDEIHSKFNILQ
jgi:hypothetical protein